MFLVVRTDTTFAGVVELTPLGSLFIECQQRMWTQYTKPHGSYVQEGSGIRLRAFGTNDIQSEGR